MKTKTLTIRLGFIALTVLMCTSIRPVCAQSGTWTSGASIPTASYGLSGAFVGGRFYAISGFATTRVGVYNPTNNTWSTAAPLPQLLQYFGTAVLDGKIYVVGGDTGGGGQRDTLYRYDPALNSWNSLAPMPLGARYNLGAAALNGKIYAVGGNNSGGTVLDRVEIYDPANNTWTSGSSLPAPRIVALIGTINGKIYVAGGQDAGGAPTTNGVAFDPVANSWSAIAPMAVQQAGISAVLGGKLYVIGGSAPDNRVQSYDPMANTWSINYALMPTGRRQMAVAADEVSGRIFAASGYNSTYSSTLEMFTPPQVRVLTNIVVTPTNPNIGIGTNQQFTATGNYSDGSSHTLTSGGNAWTSGASIPTASYGLGGAFVGGRFYAISGFATTRVGVYNPTNNTWSTAAPLPQLLQYFGTAVLDGKIYVVGGDTGGGGQRDTLYRYDPALNSWNSLAPMPLGARYNLGAAALNGKIYAVGGNNSGGTVLDRVEIYDPANNTWTSGSSLPAPRIVALIGTINGKIYVAGGQDAGGAPTTNGVAFDPVANSWSAIAPMAVQQAGISAVLGGKLYVIGGSAPDNRVQSYDPMANTWSINYALMPTGRRQMAVAADEVSGRIFAASGYNSTYSSTLEMFTPPGEVIWSCNDSGVASINTNGLATGLNVGSSTVAASAGNFAANTILTVVTQPAITNQPMNVTVSANGTTTFTAGASGGALTYQWQFNGTNIDGATGSTLTLANLNLGQVGCYTVIASNIAGTIMSSCVQLTVLGINMYAGLSIYGSMGANYRIEYVNDLNNTNWQTLTNITLTASPYLLVDTDSLNNARRFYRATIMP